MKLLCKVATYCEGCFYLFYLIKNLKLPYYYSYLITVIAEGHQLVCCLANCFISWNRNRPGGFPVCNWEQNKEFIQAEFETLTDGVIPLFLFARGRKL